MTSQTHDQAPVSSIKSTAKQPLACIRCSDRKVKCNKEDPCSVCVRHNVPCVFRPQKLSRRKRILVKDDALTERLKRCEILLREKGIDPDVVTDALKTPEHNKGRHSSTSDRSEGQETVYQLPTPASNAPEPTTSAAQAAVFKPRLLQGQKGRKFVDKLAVPPPFTRSS